MRRMHSTAETNTSREKAQQAQENRTFLILSPSCGHSVSRRCADYFGNVEIRKAPKSQSDSGSTMRRAGV